MGPRKILGPRKSLGPEKIWVLKNFWVLKKKLGPKIFFGSIWRLGSKLCALVPWSIGSLHTKSQPPTMLRTLPKVLGGWWVSGYYTKFSVLLWVKALVLAWPKLNNLQPGLRSIGDSVPEQSQISDRG